MKTPALFILPVLCLGLVACEKDAATEAREARAEAREAVQEAKEATREAAKETGAKVSEVTTDSSTRLKIKGDWNQAKGKLKQKFAELTDDDVLYVEGKEDELYGRLQTRLGKSREEVERILNEL